MNIENLHELINRYTASYEYLNSKKNDEIFKWKAAKQFQNVWFSEEYADLPFSQLFKEAKKEFSVLTDNSMISPSNGVVKLAEAKPSEVEYLFREVLFADDGGDLVVRQKHMDDFLDGMERLREQFYPGSFRYKVDRHSASCYLAFYAPAQNYIYRYSEAEAFAKRIEFGLNLGAGAAFRMDYYYQMCDAVVEALAEHPDLLEKYYGLLDSNDAYYCDKSLHLLAFDLMYCCRTYGLYGDMKYKPKAQSIRQHDLEQLREQETAEKQARLAAVREQIVACENELSQIDEVSLLNVRVMQRHHGEGVVISHSGNAVTVRFGSLDVSYFISKQYPFRPKFEDDDAVIEMFTRREALLRKLSELNEAFKQINE